MPDGPQLDFAAMEKILLSFTSRNRDASLPFPSHSLTPTVRFSVGNNAVAA